MKCDGRAIISFISQKKKESDIFSIHKYLIKKLKN